MGYPRGDPENWAVLMEHLEDYVDLSASRALDIGCGAGGLTQALSQRCSELATGDIMRSAVRKAVDKSENEHTIGSQFDAANLPFRDDHFDLVVLNGVLEWVPAASDDDPTDRQMQTLHEVNRVLAPDGLLYVGIEPRYYAPYLVGMIEHDGLPFDQILPRRLADIYYEAIRGRPLKTYIYTVSTYRRLLQQAGFEDTDVASTLPTYKSPQRIISLDDMDEIRDAIFEIDEPRWRRPIRRALATNGKLFELFGTEVGITARAGGSGPEKD